MSDPVAEAIVESEKLYEEGKLEENYKLLIEHKDSGNAEVLWRLARACRRVSQLKTKSKEEKRSLTYEGLEFAKQAVSADSNISSCQKWNGIMLSEVGDFEGAKQKIANSYVIKEHFEKAIELNPKDATCRYLMGRWCYSLADLAWYQRKIASAIFGTPPESTYEEALAHFLEAEEMSPGFYCSNLLMIGRCYEKLGKKVEAKPWFEKAKAYATTSEDDAEAVKAATDHLKAY